MSHKISLKICIGVVIFLFVLFAIGIGINSKKQGNSGEFVREASMSDALLLNKNLKNILNVYKEITPRQLKSDTLSVGEIWLVPNGMSIPNYMLRASREIERCNGKIHWMKEIRDGAAILKYEGEQGIYPLTEIRTVDSVWLPNSSKLAVVLAVRSQNKLLKIKSELLENLSFKYSLLIPSSRPELLEIGKKLNTNIIPWIPMESSENIYEVEKRNQIPIGISEKELNRRLDGVLKKFDNANGFASFNGEDFLVHPASVEKFGNVLSSKKLWFWDLSKRGNSSLSRNTCLKKELRCRKDYLEAESNARIIKALRTARKDGRAILLFELTEKSMELLENLPEMAEKQGTELVNADEVF